LETLYRFYPQLNGHVQIVDVSTPLSIEYSLREPDGGAVGLDQTPERFTNWDVVKHLDMKTPISGLYLTGQDTVLCGQPIVQMAGIITALRISGGWGTVRFGLFGFRSLLQWIFMT